VKITTTLNDKVFNKIVLIVSLGFFVDVFDMLMFSVVRTPSLKELGVLPDQLMSVGGDLISVQMAGMILGGLVWGLLGDKRGRLFVLFGSIFVYSLANLCNAFVDTVQGYTICRAVAGFGLAGELGAAVTLIGETMTPLKRGWGDTVVSVAGVLGGAAAAATGGLLHWRTSYVVAAVLGFALLITRITMLESGMYKQMATNVRRGDFFMLLKRGRIGRYLACIFVGVPIWFVIGMLVTFSPEIAKNAGVDGTVLAATTVLVFYLGQAVGDFTNGLVSQLGKSRKRALLIFILADAIVGINYILMPAGLSTMQFYVSAFVLGITNGYWTVFVAAAAEQFGTNLRATVATTVPNFVRGSTIAYLAAFKWLKPDYGFTTSLLIVGGVGVVAALIALYKLDETFGKNLAYVEE